MAKNIGKTANDRQSESHSTVGFIGNDVVSNLIELLEDPRLMLDGNADAGIDDFNGDTRAAPSCADDNPASARIAHRIGNQVAEDAREERGIAVDGEMRRHHCEGKTAAGGLRREFDGDLR